MHKRTFYAALLGALISLPAFASAPAEGEVIEGLQVPGLVLGDSRAQVEAAIGSPDFCQSAEVAGDRASCSFPVEGGGTVNVRYRGADGGNAGNSPDDIVHGIRWYEQVSGWITTAGIGTSLAASDPALVIQAYPDAEVTYNIFGDLYRVVDNALGIEVTWVLDFYSGVTNVNMAIFSPTAAPPAEHATHVVSIDLSARKVWRNREVSATVEIQDELNQAASGAGVEATWILPDGRTEFVQDVASMSGFAHFRVVSPLRGIYTLMINGVELENHEFDSETSVLEASIRVR